MKKCGDSKQPRLTFCSTGINEVILDRSRLFCENKCLFAPPLWLKVIVSLQWKTDTIQVWIMDLYPLHPTVLMHFCLLLLSRDLCFDCDANRQLVSVIISCRPTNFLSMKIMNRENIVCTLTLTEEVLVYLLRTLTQIASRHSRDYHKWMDAEPWTQYLRRVLILPVVVVQVLNLVYIHGARKSFLLDTRLSNRWLWMRSLCIVVTKSANLWFENER